MARIIIEPQDAKNVKSLVKSAVENELKIIGFGIAKTDITNCPYVFESRVLKDKRSLNLPH
ncbi:MAG: hypothetical protein H8D96_21170 [Desulfobacterales bacterium]|uniref:Uncharacterized protein n=1 Tax=Candidatus Desulfatibia vada TaxID=2841696 RepID=A0A8J6P897_9BACT|nr:hypothetical protein [Candidatus Desulfatibia vada]